MMQDQNSGYKMNNGIYMHLEPRITHLFFLATCYSLLATLFYPNRPVM